MMSNFLKAFFLFGITLLISGPVASADNAMQQFDQLPACAKLCVVTAFQSMNGACAQTDAACMCRNTSFLQTSHTCYQNSCAGADYQTALNWGLKSCAQAGVALTPPIQNAAPTPTPQPSATNTKGSAKSSATVLVSSVRPIIASTLMATLFL